MTELLIQAGSLGLGAFISIVLLIWYRDEMKSHKTDLKQIIASQTAREKIMIDAMQANTSTIQANIATTTGLQKALADLCTSLRIEDRLVELETALNRAQRLLVTIETSVSSPASDTARSRKRTQLFPPA
jgi:hypothetical protein